MNVDTEENPFNFDAHDSVDDTPVKHLSNMLITVINEQVEKQQEHWLIRIASRLPAIRYSDKFKVYWDGLIIALALYNCFSVPIKVAFQPDTMQNIEVFVIDLLIDISFFLDIVVGFRTTYVNDKGNEISDTKLMAKNYAKKRFLIDLIATLPFDLMV